MQQRTIYIILALITTAVVGVTWLQLDLIRTGLRVNEERFDASVQTALKQVADEQRKREEASYSQMQNGYTSRNAPLGQLGRNSPLQPDGSSALKLLRERSLSKLHAAGSGNLSQSEWSESIFHVLLYYRSLSLEKRIDLAAMAKSLQVALTNQGIKGSLEYGVFDVSKQHFIIHNGRYLDSIAGDSSRLLALYQSPYKVSLFDNAGEPSGFLLASLDNRQTAIWSELLLNFLASLLFALIILSCFGYTLYVIQRQKKLSEMKTDFINNMTHEFKTPIATISLATDSILSPKLNKKPEKIARFANIIKQENIRMNKQVEKVLQMAKLDKQEIKLNLAPVDLHEIIQAAVEYINLQVEPRGGSVTTLLSPEPATLPADYTHLSNVVNNLLDNANKYSPEAPQIEISTRVLNDTIELNVTDRGMGMSKEARKHIFDRFYRIPTGDRHDVKGFGLGLSYVKSIVDAHGGSIRVKSELGKGSSFILSFPTQAISQN